MEVVNVSEDNLIDAPEWSSHPFSCKYCLYWEFPEQCVDPAQQNKKGLMSKKAQWLTRVSSEFGGCAKIAYVDGQPIAYAQYAPGRYLPNSAGYASGPPSDDAVLISCLFIPDKRFRAVGIGSQLLHSIVLELKQRGTKAIETFARKGSPENPSGPVHFYLRNGFRIHRDDEEFPLMRLDL